jgi:hypothetical protein
MGRPHRSGCLLFLQPEWSKSATVTPLIIEYIEDHPMALLPPTPQIHPRTVNNGKFVSLPRMKKPSFYSVPSSFSCLPPDRPRAQYNPDKVNKKAANLYSKALDMARTTISKAQ